MSRIQVDFSRAALQLFHIDAEIPREDAISNYIIHRQIQRLKIREDWLTVLN
jgi:hypothetical protein